MDLTRKRVLITGASAGIGQELARLCAPQAEALVLLARRLERLEELKTELQGNHPHLKVIIERCDLESMDQMAGAIHRIQKELESIDILINNAGLGSHGFFERADWEKEQRQIHVNIRALTYLTYRFLPQMKERSRGGILNISSGFGLSWLPGFATYVGTKHFVTGFTETLRAEMTGTGVTVTQICPGPVATEFGEIAGITNGQIEPPHFLVMSASRCARIALKAFQKEKAMVIPGPLFKFLLTFDQFMPRFMVRALAGVMARQMRKMNTSESTSGE